MNRRRCPLAESAEWPAPAARSGCAAEQTLEQVAEIGRLGSTEVEIFEALRAAGARLRTAGALRIAAEAAAERHLRIAFLVDFAAVVLGAFVFVGEQIVGGGDL